MKLQILFIACLFIFNGLNAQTDSLSRYSLPQLDSLYQTKKKPQEQLPYTLAMLQKGEKELDTKDTSYAKLLFKVGNTYLNLRDFLNATTYLQKAIDIWQQKMPIHADYAHCLTTLGAVYYYQGKYEATEKYWLQTLSIRKEVLGEKHPEYAKSLNNLGVLHYGMGDYSKSEKYWLQALSIRKEVLGEKHTEYAKSLNNLAALYKEIGDYGKSENFYLFALNIFKEVLGEKHPEYAKSLHNLGTLYYEMKDYGKVEKFYLQALDIRKEVLGEKNPEFALIINNLGALYKDVGDYEKAEKFHLQALDIQKEVLGEKHPEYATNFNNIGVLYYKMGDYGKAEKFSLQALDIQKEVLGEKHPEYAKSLHNIGALYYGMGDYNKAEKFHLLALGVRKEVLGEEHSDYAQSLDNLGKLYIATDSYLQADSFLTIAYHIKNTNLSTNFAWLSEKGKAAYWQQKKDFYEDLNNCAVQTAVALPKTTQLAYQSNLMSKSLLLESSKEIEEAVSLSKDSITLLVYKELKDKRRLINHLVSSGKGKKEILARYETEADSLDKILVSRLGEYAAAKRKFQITWKEVQTALSENDAAVEFARFYNEKDSQYYYLALVLRKGYEYPKLVKLGAEKAIAEIPAGKGFANLYKLIWAPIDSLLEGVEKIYYSPDGYLNNISFAALCSKGTEQVISTKDIKRGGITKTSTQTSQCNYLSDKYTLHQLSTTRYLAEGLKESKTESSILVFGGVNYDEIPSTGDTLAEVQFMDMDDYALAENISRSSTNQSRMEYLPGTQTELQNVQKIMNKKKWKVRAYSDKNASENTFKSEIQKEAPGILHIATHGFAFPDIVEKKKTFGEETKTYRDSDNPMARCGLLFAGANHSWTGKPQDVLSKSGEDGILTALEVSNLPLKNTKLVVLSACETGLGKIQGTEGVFGLKRGFKLALVEQIIVSLWSVPDNETMELMDIFYNDLAKTRNAVLSFEKAQKEMRKKYADRPDLWAGFVLVR